MKMLNTPSTGNAVKISFFLWTYNIHITYMYVRYCKDTLIECPWLLSCLELHPRYSYTHAHDIDAHAYYSNSGVTRAVRT